MVASYGWQKAQLIVSLDRVALASQVRIPPLHTFI
jgi:hypothetical protein